MKVIEDVRDIRAFIHKARHHGKFVTLVPTMGALHDGHRELLRIGRLQSGLLVMSLFVNPTQFGPDEDFKDYPRDREHDLAMASEEQVDVVFAPVVEEMYADDADTFIDVGALTEHLCGASRPTHFRGVATVVAKLFNIVKPDRAIFGLKDYQQFLVIKKMVRDLNLTVEIRGVETVREPDGLAMSSRNAYMNADERRAALVIFRSFKVAKRVFNAGGRDGAEIAEKVKKVIETEPGAVVEYVKVVDPATLDDLAFIGWGALVAVAVRFGRTRLIDNCLLGSSE